MTHPAPSKLWRRIDAAWRTIAAHLRPDRTDPTDDPGGLRTDGGDGRAADRTRRYDDADHLADVPDGAGCTEIWEYLSERGAAEAEADD